MARICLSISSSPSTTLPMATPSPSFTTSRYASNSSSSSQRNSCRCSLFSVPMFGVSRIVSCHLVNKRRAKHVVRMAPDEEKLTQRNPLDFPIEWDRPKPGRRPDIFPKFSPMKTPLPAPMPYDPPEEDDEEEEKKEEEEEEEGDADKEEEHPPEQL